MANAGLWQGLNQATQNLAATGMNILNYQANRADAEARQAMDRDRLSIVREQADMQKRAFDNAEKKRLEQEAIDNAYAPASVVSPNLSKVPRLKKQVVEAMTSAGFKVNETPDGEIYAPNKAWAYAKRLVRENTDAMKQSVENIQADLTEQAVGLAQQISELQKAGKTDEKTLGPLLAQQKAIKEQLAQSYSMSEKVMEQVAIEQAKTHGTKNPSEASLAEAAARGDANAQKALDLLREQKKAGATNVNVTNKVGQESMVKLGEEMSKDLVGERKDVMGAVASLNNIKEAEKLVKSGIITGTGAEYLVNMGNFLSSRLGVNLAKDPVANTQAYAATMGNQVGQIIKQFGSGTGLSDADREYAEKIVGGKITLNEGAIKRLMEINRKAFTNVVKNYNKRAEQAMKKPGAESLPYDLRIEYDFGPERPESQLPAGLKAGW